MFERLMAGGSSSSNQPTSVDPVIDGATAQPKSFLKGLISDLGSQRTRVGDDAALLASIAETQVFAGGLVDDRKYQVEQSNRQAGLSVLTRRQIEQILQLCASLPADSAALTNLTGDLIKALWENLLHPPLSYEGDEFRYRMADGSNNNIQYPHLGQAGSSYARTVAPQTLQPGVPPDPGVVFDAVYARGAVAREHPNRISSMLFYLAAIIIHDIFHTDEADYRRVKTSSYLDLAPLYGSSQEEQNKIRTFSNGLLKPDTFCESRILGFPPGVSAIVVCFNRYHNYIAQQLKIINEGGRFTEPTNKSDKKAWAKLDNDLFQTARLVTCGLYINIILIDYVRTILNLNRTSSTWTLDPRKAFKDVFDSSGTPLGVGNAVSVEFNLVYRWHSAISVKDEKWTIDLYQELFPGKDLGSLKEEDLVNRLREWAMGLNPDPSTWELDRGNVKRNANGAFEDADLVKILADATEDVACGFGARNVPVVMKLIETLGIRQAREWQVATLNEFRKFFGLEPHKDFSDITSNEEVQKSLKALYTHPDYVELYPGIVAEDAKIPMEPGSGLCPGFTISRVILSDAVALTRGDRFYTVDYTPANLTNWGWNQVNTDPDVAGGGVFYNLVMRALPFWYRGNSVYAMYPFTVPGENRKILEKLGTVDQYDFGRPSYVGVPTTIKSWKAVTTILENKTDFKVPWGDHTFYLTGHDYMLSGDGPEEAAQHSFINNAIYCPANGPDEVRQFYEDLTTQLIEIGSERLRGNRYQLDAVRDVANSSHTIFVARLFNLPLKEEHDLKIGVTVDQLYLAMAVLFAYVFLDLDTARSFKLRSGAKTATDSIAKLIKIVCEAVHVGKTLHLDSLFSMGRSGQMLQDYGVNLLQRLFDGGKSVDEVVYAIIPTAAAAVATQAQHVSQMLDLYLTPQYQHHWADIQKLAWSDDPKDFEKLKSYALEANRLAPAAFGLLRISDVDTDIQDGRKKVHIKAGDQIYTDFIAAGLDPKAFPKPEEINLNRDRSLYIHHGYGPHRCIGRPIVEISMAAQLKVFAKLKNLRRAPGPQGELKFSIPAPDPVSSHPAPNPGSIKVFLKEDWSDWWPFPTSKSTLILTLYNF